MPVYLALSAFGTFVLDEKNEVVAKHVVYPDAGLAVSNPPAVERSFSSQTVNGNDLVTVTLDTGVSGGGH